MLIRNNERTGRAIADKLGLNVRARLLPEDMMRDITALKAQGPVVMVGYGNNDAPALAAASMDVAMGRGTAAASETADAVLLSGRVSGVAEPVALSPATLTDTGATMLVTLNLLRLLCWRFMAEEGKIR